MQVQSLGWEDPLEEEMETHSSILAWETPRTEETGYSPWGHKESDTTEHAHVHTSLLFSAHNNPGKQTERQIEI